MDRLIHRIMAGTTGLVTVVGLCCAEGCRSPHSEVPPGKPYQTTGGAPPVGFNMDPHPSVASGMASLYGNNGPGGMLPDGQSGPANPTDMVLGTPTQGPATLGLPTDHQYGPPGTAVGGASSEGGSSSLANALLKALPSASQEVAKDPGVQGTKNSMGGAYP